MISIDEARSHQDRRSSPTIADRKLTIRYISTEIITWSDSHLPSWTNCRHRFGHSARRERSKRIGAPTARVALPRWKYPRVVPETISLRDFTPPEVSEWASELVSECCGRAHRTVSSGRYPTYCPRRHPGKREHREPPVNYVYKTFHKKSIDDRPTIKVLNEVFAILSLLFVEEMKDLWAWELRDLNVCWSLSMSRLRIYVLESLKFCKSKNKGLKNFKTLPLKY